MVVVMWLMGGACIGATGHVVLGVRGLRRRRSRWRYVGGSADVYAGAARNRIGVDLSG